jgi:ubiquinone/menaquinone biosynthesis C-methylase UbiE
MREDWNRRAREDPHYYVAFGRRDQGEEEFLATAREIAVSLENELKRLPADVKPRARRALEIGCGPGRLMAPLSRHFGEIHGVDVSDEMIGLARRTLSGIAHAHAHHAPGSDLGAFADESFDFVYSYAVFQHIPDREVVMRYFAETRRVLKPGGIARFQVNGLPESSAAYDTWCGVRISAAEVADFAREHDFQLLALEGVATQYLWTTWRKQPQGWCAGLAWSPHYPGARIRRLTSAYSSEPAVPARGRFAALSLWMEGLPPECDLNHLEIRVGGQRAFPTYAGHPEHDGLQQLNTCLPELPTGLTAVEVLWLDHPLCAASTLRVVPPGPPVPRIVKVSDGIDLLSGRRIVTGSVKVVLEELEQPGDLAAVLGGRRLLDLESFCTDPRIPRHEVNFKVPPDLERGRQLLEMALGRRRLGAIELDLA